MDPNDPPLETVEPGYRTTLRVRFAMVSVVLLAASLLVDRLVLAEAGFGLLLPVTVLVAAAAVIALVPQRTYLRLRYRLTDQLLQVVRGWLFQTDTIVPLVRVQHLDVVRGPLDKLFGTASLVVHTAGTHNSTVTLPGLSPERAAQIRGIIRDYVRADLD
jgi:membrane protein YdbS with pleckstrin-like domain